jgi:hypothetical protein
VLQEIGQRLVVKLLAKNVDPEGIHRFLLLLAVKSGLDVPGWRQAPVIFKEDFQIILKLRAKDNPHQLPAADYCLSRRLLVDTFVERCYLENVKMKVLPECIYFEDNRLFR